MLAVSNTSPISNLASIGRLNLLTHQFSQIWLPQAVARELSNHPNPMALASIQIAIEKRTLQVGAVEDSALLRILKTQLDAGEAEAISFAAQTNASILLLDEKEGRNAARRIGIPVTGVLGILLKAKELGQIAEVGAEMHELRKKAGFYIAPQLEVKIRIEAGETL